MNPQSRFDQSASQWDTSPTRVDLARAVGTKIVNAIPIQPSWRGLDFGAGTGLLTLNLQPHVSSLVAVDTSAGMLQVLNQKLAAFKIPNVTPHQWDLTSQPFPETGFDLVVSSMTFHHIADVPLILKRLAALLKPDGWLAFADLESEDGSFHGETNDVFHHGFTRTQIANWLAETGFSHIAVRDVHVITKPGPDGAPRDYKVFLAVAQKLKASP